MYHSFNVIFFSTLFIAAPFVQKYYTSVLKWENK